jgi:hypothetical protein
MRWVNLASGAVIAAFGALTLLGLLLDTAAGRCM